MEIDVDGDNVQLRLSTQEAVELIGKLSEATAHGMKFQFGLRTTHAIVTSAGVKPHAGVLSMVVERPR